MTLLAAVFLAGLLLGVLLACLAWVLADRSSARPSGTLLDFTGAKPARPPENPSNVTRLG